MYDLEDTDDDSVEYVCDVYDNVDEHQLSFLEALLQ